MVVEWSGSNLVVVESIRFTQGIRFNRPSPIHNTVFICHTLHITLHNKTKSTTIENRQLLANF